MNNDHLSTVEYRIEKHTREHVRLELDNAVCERGSSGQTSLGLYITRRMYLEVSREVLNVYRKKNRYTLLT